MYHIFLKRSNIFTVSIVLFGSRSHHFHWSCSGCFESHVDIRYIFCKSIYWTATWINILLAILQSFVKYWIPWQRPWSLGRLILRLPPIPRVPEPASCPHYSCGCYITGGGRYASKYHILTCPALNQPRWQLADRVLTVCPSCGALETSSETV